MPERPDSSHDLDHLKKEAKRWLRALRAGDATARERFLAAWPAAPIDPNLRDVQHALARERGSAGWAELAERVACSPGDRANHVPDVDKFLEAACPDHHVRGRSNHVRALHMAERLLQRHPEIRRNSFTTAVVTGDIHAVERALVRRPALAQGKRTTEASAAHAAPRSGGGNADDLFRDHAPKDWEPLLFLCFTRLALPEANDNAVAIATMLLDAGADPCAHFMAGGSRYTPLVGVIGKGEENRPAHPRRDALVALLLARGADPYDNQVIYNLSFGGDVLWYLEAAHARSSELGRAADWDDPEWTMLDMGGYGSGARWHLELAIRRGDMPLAAWCLAHGANPASAPARARSLPRHSLYEEAVRQHQPAIAELLLRYGAMRVEPVLNTLEQLTASALRHDAQAVRAAVARDRKHLDSPLPLFAATARNDTSAVELLLDAGFSPDVRNASNERPLHVASAHDAVDVARRLVAAGATIDPVETEYNGTPLGRAAYYRHQRMIDLLAPLSDDLWELVSLGRLDRLRELLAARPALGRTHSQGQTPLMWLPADETLAIEIARMFLENGADRTVRNGDGMTAADKAERQGMRALAALLG